MIIRPSPHVSLGISNISDKCSPPMGSWEPITKGKSPESGVGKGMGFGSSPDCHS